MQKNDKNYLEALTWLRGFAAFLVVDSHVLRTIEVKYSEADAAVSPFLMKLFDLGDFGVSLFFVLSGCTLYVSNGAKIKKISDFSGFYFKRFMRIWPAFAFSIFLYMGLIEIFHLYYNSDESLWIAQIDKPYTLINVFQYLTLSFNLTGPSGLFNGPYWSLPVEFQYYLLLPVVLVLMRNKYTVFIMPLLASVILYFVYKTRPLPIAQYEVFKMGYMFFIGVFLACLYASKPFKFRPVYTVVGLALMVLFSSSIYNDWIVISKKVFFINDKANFYGVASIVCVYMVLNMRKVHVDNLLTRFLHRYGEISYSIYLFHMLFIASSVLIITNFGLYGEIIKTCIVILFGFVGSYFFSILSYKFIEKPSLEWGRHFSKRKK